MGDEGRNGPKRRVWHRLGPRYFFFKFFMFLILINDCLFYLGSIYVLEAHGGFGWATREETGPHDARCVIWAHTYVFFFYISFLFLFFIFFDYYDTQRP